MAARPNALRTLEYGKKLVENQLGRLHDMIAMAEKVLQENQTLTPEDIAGYKACISIAKKQITQFDKIASYELPDVEIATTRKRGRPSKAELEQLAAARGEKPAKKSTTSDKTTEVEAAAPATRRGRPPKVKPEYATLAAATAVAAAPKRRGRPPKVKPEEAPDAAVANAAPVKRRGRPPKAKNEVNGVDVAEVAPKRRGRPPGSGKKIAAVEANSNSNSNGNGVDAPVKRGPGRPKGSKNKVLLNGKNAEVQAA